MPRSKRNRVVTLSKTQKKVLNRTQKEDIVQEIRNCLDKYRHVYVLEGENLRNVHLTNLRAKLKGSKFYFGRNKLCKIALGVDASSEHVDGIHAVSQHLVGQTSLLFSNMDLKEVTAFLAEHEKNTFARSGFVATERVELEEVS
mmetsp:Transcript_7362/g.22439  ORF Transcript_7362/g.22439 Transcript_7362/m.22439 type:complete len:144 (-) Transcript_7362:1391-1822(-)